MIRKAVIPAAGFGTRFLPASKAQPKEMLIIVDKPVIQYVVEEAVESGITDILMIIGKGKRAIEEHFDRNFELEAELEAKGKQAELDAIRRISSLANVHFVWQKELRGLGHAICCARQHVGDEPFAVLLGDTLLKAPEPATAQLVRAYDRYGETIVGLEQVARDRIGRYGVISGRSVTDGVTLIEGVVEKPDPDEAPSNLAIAGRYVLSPEIFECLDRTEPAANGEIQLTDALRLLLSTRALYGLRVNGTRYDVGNKVDFIRTNVMYALMRDDLKADVSAFIEGLHAE